MNQADGFPAHGTTDMTLGANDDGSACFSTACITPQDWLAKRMRMSALKDDWRGTFQGFCNSIPTFHTFSDNAGANKISSFIMNTLFKYIPAQAAACKFTVVVHPFYPF